MLVLSSNVCAHPRPRFYKYSYKRPTDRHRGSGMAPPPPLQRVGPPPGFSLVGGMGVDPELTRPERGDPDLS